MKSILVLNAGSSSLKFQVFAVRGGGLVRQLRGRLEDIGVGPRLRISGPGEARIEDRSYPTAAVPDLDAAIREVRGWLRENLRGELLAVGHRVVHGGPEYASPVVVDARVLDRLAGYEALAPLHQPNNLAPIRLALESEPDVPQVACFDTAFHRGHEPVADVYALPYALLEEGIRRYGFHGLSYEFVAGRLREIAPEAAAGRVIAAHLGAGASLCALLGGRSVESTMGFTALDGLPMGTRPGQLDPGVVLHLIMARGMSPGAVFDLLYRDSGLKGLSGVSSDMRELLASGEPRAALAVAHFVHRIGLNAGLLAAALGGLDAFVFTAGIGEHSPDIRARVAAKLAWLGAVLDPVANRAGGPLISASGSRVGLYVVPTDEELMIARHVLALVGA